MSNLRMIFVQADLRAVGSEFDVKFFYATSPNASAVQWLSAKTTSSGKYVSPRFPTRLDKYNLHFGVL